MGHLLLWYFMEVRCRYRNTISFLLSVVKVWHEILINIRDRMRCSLSYWISLRLIVFIFIDLEYILSMVRSLINSLIYHNVSSKTSSSINLLCNFLEFVTNVLIQHKLPIWIMRLFFILATKKKLFYLPTTWTRLFKQMKQK